MRALGSAAHPGVPERARAFCSREFGNGRWLWHPHSSLSPKVCHFFGEASMPSSLNSLVWLPLGAFAVGTEGLMIAGLLPTLARDLNVSLAATGYLVTALSLAYAIGAPLMAVLTAGLERRRLLAIAMAGFGVANCFAALAPSYTGLLAARLLLALSAATFMPAASGYAATMGGPERRGRALSVVTNGLTVAIIVGVPFGVLVGQDFGWRATFLGVSDQSFWKDTSRFWKITAGECHEHPFTSSHAGRQRWRSLDDIGPWLCSSRLLTVQAGGRGIRATSGRAAPRQQSRLP